MSSVAVNWGGPGTQMFVGRDSFGHVTVSGSWPQDNDDEWQEWKGLKPSDLLLLSLASCSAYDVVMIMERQRQELTALYVHVDGKQQPEPPYAFTAIHIHYTASGNNIESQKLQKAIELSEEKYCSVAATIRGVAKITHTFEVKEK
ncbi:MAG TPA: OsmC family protein [Anaerolineae bacterium]|nr:OsmC family protein [Anaerolineae bacterium]